MAAFSDLKAARLGKQFKSYAIPADAEQNQHPPVSSIEGSGENLGENLYSLPSALKVRESRSHGRGLYTALQILPGNVVISANPYATALSNQYLENYCSSCFGLSPEGGLKRCPTCRTIFYCGSACQNRDWPLHKLECGAIQKWANEAPSPEVSVPNDAIRCLARLLWMRKKKSADSAWVKQVDAMQSHRESLPASSFELHTHLSHTLVRYLGLSSTEELVKFGFSSARELLDVTSRFVTNTFSITSPSLTPIGASISPVIALINHSCDPNAVVVFPRTSKSSEEPLMQVIALRQIEPGEEVLTSYIDITLPKVLRQSILKETYNFDCSCAMCMSSMDVDPRESVWCPKSCGGMTRIPKDENSFCRCVKCQAPVKDTDAILDAMRIGQEALDKATALQFKDLNKAKQLTTNLIPILISLGITLSSHPLLALLRLHHSLSIASLPASPSQEALDETIRAVARSSAGLTPTLCHGHPIRGITLAELGKILMVDEPAPRQHGAPAEASVHYPPSGPARLKLAYETLLDARDELLIGFGRRNEGGQVGQEVRKILISVEKEIGIWRRGVKNVLERTPGFSNKQKV